LRASISHLREEYGAWQALLNEQPTVIAHFLGAQAALITEAIIQRDSHVQFTLPNEVVVDISSNGKGEIGYIPTEARQQQIGGLIERIARGDIGTAIHHRLTELEQSTDQGVAVSAGLLRHATVMHMIYNVLPAGLSVTYEPDEGEEIPSLPAGGHVKPRSAYTARSDAIAEETQHERGRDELLVPYVPDARRFYLPQWVAFDQQQHLLMNSLNEAEACIGSMQDFLRILHAAVALAPYCVADPAYQAKRYGMLGQLVNQGRALARYQTRDVIRVIQERAEAKDLNRGLSLSLPYFDDQALKIKLHNFEVIPAGRIMFIPAFVVRAAEEEQAKVVQDTRLSGSTRKHLLIELKELEAAFQTA
jgi:hypothetical protein